MSKRIPWNKGKKGLQIAWNKLDLIGQRFGRLLVIEDSGRRYGGKTVIWRCRCDCGNLTEVISTNLRGERTKSCGCLARENSANILRRVALRQKGKNNPHFKHGDSKTRLYETYGSMKRRCYNKNAPCYKSYGGRGITVCPEWRDNYSAFKLWAILNGYQDTLTIDRINNDGNYCPENCQWITLSENTKKSWQERI